MPPVARDGRNGRASSLDTLYQPGAEWPNRTGLKGGTAELLSSPSVPMVAAKAPRGEPGAQSISGLLDNPSRNHANTRPAETTRRQVAKSDFVVGDVPWLEEERPFHVEGAC